MFDKSSTTILRYVFKLIIVVIWFYDNIRNYKLIVYGRIASRCFNCWLFAFIDFILCKYFSSCYIFLIFMSFYSYILFYSKISVCEIIIFIREDKFASFSMKEMKNILIVPIRQYYIVMSINFNIIRLILCLWSIIYNFCCYYKNSFYY